MKGRTVVPTFLLVLGLVAAAPAGIDPSRYEDVTQAELLGQRDALKGHKVRIEGPFLFTGSDFCYQIRRTEINTKDYFCFALGSPTVVRLYIRKDHPQVEELLSLERGTVLTAYGTFDYLGNDYNFMIVDEIEVE